VLRRLAARRALRPAEQVRLVALLEERARAWRAQARPRAELSVRRELAALSPTSAEASEESRRTAEARAAASWRELAELTQPSERSKLRDGGGSCRPGPDDPCALPAFSLPAGWFAQEDLPSDPATAASDALLLNCVNLTDAFRLGGLPFVRRMARHPQVDLFVETLHEEDETSPFNWETIAWLELLRGRFASAERAFNEAVSFDPSPAEGFTRVAISWEAAGQLPQACVAWRRAAAVHNDAWDPRWRRLLRCVEAAPQVGDVQAWMAFLQSKVPDADRVDHEHWLSAPGPRDD